MTIWAAAVTAVKSGWCQVAVNVDGYWLNIKSEAKGLNVSQR